MINNILDQRRNEHNLLIEGVFEIFTADSADHLTEWFECVRIDGLIKLAMEHERLVTVYLYDCYWIRDNMGLLAVIHPIIKERPFGA